jgi:hypothetical protein
VAEDSDEHEALAGGVGREVGGDVVVVGGRADRAQTQRVGRELHPGAEERRLQLGQPVAAVAEVGEDRLEIRQYVEGVRRVRRDQAARS